MLGKNLIAAAGNGISTGDVAEAIDYDGTNDFLSRSSDLTGNANGKTFTFSAWVYWTGTGDPVLYASASSNSNPGFIIKIDTGGLFYVGAYNAAGSTILFGLSQTTVISANTFTNLLVSIDLANSANRYMYINDVQVTPTWFTYTNDTIDATQSTHIVGANLVFPSTYFDQLRGRLSNVFLDYTYRNLSVEANRRLFVTADLKPADGQASLNPILYLPMSDPTQPGLNQGTGGNFTLTGTVARSGRGPNQYNAPYSTMSGFLSRTTVPTGLTDGKQFTFQCSFYAAGLANRRAMLSISAPGPNQTFGIYINANTLVVVGRNSAIADVLTAIVTNPTFVDFRNYTITMSVDLTDTAKRHIYINGVAATSVTWGTYTNANMDLTGTIYNIGALHSTTDQWSRELGPLWFNTSYVDLSVPDNLAKFVSGTGVNAKPVDPGASGELPTGTSPILYFPMYGNNAGKNYGSGGNFTVNNGPYAGVRGPNEYWGNIGTLAGNVAGLAKLSALTGVSNGKTFSFSTYVRTPNPIDGGRLLTLNTSTGGLRLVVSFEFDGNTGSYGTLVITARNSAGVEILRASRTQAVIINSTNSIQASIDLADTAKRSVYVNGVLQTMTWTTYTNDTIDFSGANRCVVGANWSGSVYNTFWKGGLSEMYLTTDYLDFSQEANRLKFRDAFGNPVNLPQQIEGAAIPNPALYLRFVPSSFGTNSGTGGDFTNIGFTDGGQF